VKDWERIYLEIRPVMGAPDDTDAGHSYAEASARLQWARIALRWYEDDQVDESVFLKYLREALR
jgi:hypothetical protein